MIHQQSPFGIQYRLGNGTTLVLYRGHTYERHGDFLVLPEDGA